MRILVLEPYFGGSHKTFLDGLLAHLPFDFILLTLPARKWKWRMRLAAPFFAEQVISVVKDQMVDIIFCSSFIDVATLRSLLPASVSSLPFYTYFHENQFAYPVRREDERDFHFGLTNLTSVLASDRAAFNTRYNLQTFLDGVEQILRICPDMKFPGIKEKILARSTILYPGVDFSLIDRTTHKKRQQSSIPVIIWNHRWEHDKNPKYFFKTLYELDKAGLDFRLIILGQCFRKEPAVFSEVQERLKGKIIHCGFVESSEKYAHLLAQGDIAVSTSRHEFYGISVIEAVRAGCTPLLPKRLSYPELFPDQYLYEGRKLHEALKSLIEKHTFNDRLQGETLTDKFSWPALKVKYVEWFKVT